MQETIEIERTPGFANADGSNVTFRSANEAFLAYLSATGQPKTKENKAKFKAWLTEAKKSEQFQKVIQQGKDKIQAEIQKQKDKVVTQQPTQTESTPEPEAPKKTTIMGMPPMLAVGVIVAAVGLISWGIYTVVKKKKQGAA